jgi:hypothetical protein
MREVIPLALSSGGQILVEVDGERSVVRAGTGPAAAISRASGAMSQVFDEVRGAADDALDALRTMESRPTKIELKFGVALTAEANAMIAKAGSSANLSVTVTWERDEDDDS